MCLTATLRYLGQTPQISCSRQLLARFPFSRADGSDALPYMTYLWYWSSNMFVKFGGKF
jgi:hypothetical protein